MTEPEVLLWWALRHEFPWKFRRQEPIGPYVCDFVCYPKRVVVEVDGAQHGESDMDAVRDSYLESLGFTVLRVWNGDVMTGLDDVVDRIVVALESRPDLHPARPARDRRQ